MQRDTKVLQEDAYKSSDGSVQGLVCKACLTRRQKASRATRWYGEFTVCGFQVWPQPHIGPYYGGDWERGYINCLCARLSKLWLLICHIASDSQGTQMGP